MSAEHYDVLIVGAGISGIGAAWHLKHLSPDRTFVVVDGRDDLGGTWDLFRYPGIRSDSDMHTLGYRFKPWTAEKAIADGGSILEYLHETVEENGLAEHLRFGLHIARASWSTADARWTVEGTRKATGEPVVFTCNYLFMCSGYYSYDHGYTPEFAGRERFAGPIIHPQAWPEDLDYTDKRVVIIGSGATAMTLVPAMAPTAAHVTMLQRSPTYVVSRPDIDKLANGLRKVLPERVAYTVTRGKNITFQQLLYRSTRRAPERVKSMLLSQVRKELGPDYDVDKHFTPTYNPWDQRLCLVPNNDLFVAIRSGKASIVTDTIETFTEEGIQLASGEVLPADIIVTATGLRVVNPGEMSFVVDGDPVVFGDTWTYKGFAYSDVPNLAWSFGYINASWTLRSDLTCEYVCRLLNHLRDTSTDQCTPRLRPSDRNMPARPWIDDFPAGYLRRVMDQFPKQGDREPWLNPQNYRRDRKMFRKDPIDDGVMQFTRVPAKVREAVGVAD